jgi:hypothetical protein
MIDLMAKSGIHITPRSYTQSFVISPLDTQPKVSLSFEPGPAFKPIPEVEEENSECEKDE